MAVLKVFKVCPVCGKPMHYIDDKGHEVWPYILSSKHKLCYSCYARKTHTGCRVFYSNALVYDDINEAYARSINRFKIAIKHDVCFSGVRDKNVFSVYVESRIFRFYLNLEKYFNEFVCYEAFVLVCKKARSQTKNKCKKILLESEKFIEHLYSELEAFLNEIGIGI